MGRVFLLQFDHTDPDNQMYVCRKCQIHIALGREETFFHFHDVDELNGSLFTTAINWHSLGEESNRRIGMYVVAEIYCNNCGYPLGFQFIEILNHAVFTRAEEKHLLVRGSKISLWNGYEILPDPESGDEDEVDEDEVDEEDEVFFEDEVDEDEVDHEDEHYGNGYNFFEDEDYI